jgi:hypothetical protein
MLADVADQRPTARYLLDDFFPQPAHALQGPRNGIKPSSFGVSSPLTNQKNAVEAQGTVQADSSTLFEALTVTGKHPATDGPLHVEMRGRQIPQRAIFYLKTRAKETR